MSVGTELKVLAVIPARYASERFPGKVLAPLAGKPLIAHTAERTMQARLVDETLVATDDPRVVAAIEPLGIRTVMTSPHHTCGTDRIAEVAEASDADIVVNVQGDEPLIDPDTIDAAIQPLLDDPTLNMATVRHRITDPKDIADPNVVKVVCDAHGRALYFSRSPIPYVRDKGESVTYWVHVGLYVFRREFLLQYAAMEPTPLEKAEKLEQLRAMENGVSIAVIETTSTAIGVDTPEDLERARAILEGRL